MVHQREQAEKHSIRFIVRVVPTRALHLVRIEVIEDKTMNRRREAWATVTLDLQKVLVPFDECLEGGGPNLRHGRLAT